MVSLNDSDCIPTPVYYAEKLGQVYGLSKLYLKLEGNNRTGTFKDRAARIIVKDAIEKGYSGITAGTCGNYGVSIVQYAALSSIHCVIFIPKRYNSNFIKSNMKNIRVKYVDGTYETAVAMSELFANRNGYYNANPSGPASMLAIRGYENITHEVMQQIEGDIESVWLSVGNGTGLAGIYEGFKKYSYIPKMCAVSSKGNNSIIVSLCKGAITELRPEAITETAINEPLLNWRSYQAYEAFQAITATGGMSIGVTDKAMLAASATLFRYESISTRPASAAALAGLYQKVGALDKQKAQLVILTS